MNDDKLQIIELLNRYLLYVDSHNADLWVGLFTEDGVFENPPDVAEGTEQLQQFITRWHASGITKSIHHMIGSLMVEVDGSAATAHSYYWAVEVETAPAVVASGAFRDTLRKVNGIWKFAHRKHIIDPSYKFRSTQETSGS